MMITHKLDMDLQQRGMLPRIDVVQGDANTRELELSLYSNGELWNVPEDASVWMRYCKSNGTKGVYDTLADGTSAWKAAENVLTMILEPQMLTEEGMVLAQVEIVQGADSLATFTIHILVERNVAADVVASEDYVNMLQWMEAELDKLLAQARDSGDFDGPQGIQGPKGEPGTNAYTCAVEAGYKGTEAEFWNMIITSCLPLAGGTMAGTLNMGGQALSGLAEPTAGTDAATKNYVDGKRVVTSVVLQAANWSDTAPYSQTVSVGTVVLGDWINMLPSYYHKLEDDLKIKAAFECISYATAQRNRITMTCLERKPEINFTVYLESMR